VTIRLDTAAVDYFKQMADELGMPYQNVINCFAGLRRTETAPRDSMAHREDETAGRQTMN
jgi:hypothetical protein